MSESNNPSQYDDDEESTIQSVHNFDSSSVHTTDFFSTTDIDDWGGRSTNPNTPSLSRVMSKRSERSSRMSKDSRVSETLTESSRQLSSLTINEDQKTPTNERKKSVKSTRSKLTSSDSTEQSSTVRLHTVTSTDMDQNSLQGGAIETKSVKLWAGPKCGLAFIYLKLI